MSSLNKIRILENDEQKKTNPNSNEAFELGFVDSLKPPIIRRFQTVDKRGCPKSQFLIDLRSSLFAI